MEKKDSASICYSLKDSLHEAITTSFLCLTVSRYGRGMRIKKTFPLIKNLANRNSKAVQVYEDIICYLLTQRKHSTAVCLTAQSHGLQLTPVKGCLEVHILSTVHPREGLCEGVLGQFRMVSPLGTIAVLLLHESESSRETL